MFAPPRGLAAVRTASPSDIVLLSALRTPVCRAHKGGFKDAYPEELLATVLDATRRRFPADMPVDDVAVGVVLSELGGSKAARMALNHVGFDAERTSLYTVNRACASSLQGIAGVAAALRTGDIGVGIAAGMESMTRNYASRAVPTDPWPALVASSVPRARHCLMPMGLTAENVARRYGIEREAQDVLAAESHRRAAEARRRGRFEAETVAVTISATGETVTADDGIRESTTTEKLRSLPLAFVGPDSTGTCTAGNSSQVSDGAAAMLLTTRSTATRLGLRQHVLARFVSATVAGCQPDEMGVGPVVAVPRLLSRHGLTIADINKWEVNEAFAAQAVHCLRRLGLEPAWEQGRVNGDGGAIALGHPLGATGARLTATLIHGLQAGDLGVVTMCVGTGMGMAALFVRE
ncbi:putative acetyl-CoA C-acyltransferase precursor [Ophiocordyceps camponoti-floridani]|uniref:acetyl-CoA C-acyltransferase n=1 Tax=Ophiocordyceps camponoti-floridani TaxID=2030778 RepID=A0A8H4QDC9_9HYPO|nr:putative acetyl-CoA C-acyltransferase precursor [Ophiocordyceps camponoti-floridani]